MMLMLVMMLMSYYAGSHCTEQEIERVLAFRAFFDRFNGPDTVHNVT